MRIPIRNSQARSRAGDYLMAGVKVARHAKGPAPYFSASNGEAYLADSLQHLKDHVPDGAVDLIVTSPPFGLVRKKAYGNKDADEYVDWFREFGAEFHRVLKDSGSLVIDIGGAWISGQPTRSLYHYELLVMLCRELGFHLAQEFYWWNPSKLPSPAEWVTVRRIRVKDAVNCVWWLSKTPWPKASNKRVPWPYSDAMQSLLKNGYQSKLRPSGHDISDNFSTDNGTAIPPNLLAIPNTESNSAYLRYCRDLGITPHPARFPSDLPEFFIRMLTDPRDLVLDPFAGSCVTGEVCERLDRRWVCVDLVEDYLKGARGRFPEVGLPPRDTSDLSYRAYHPASAWKSDREPPLASDGGKSRPVSRKLASKPAAEAQSTTPPEVVRRPKTAATRKVTAKPKARKDRLA